MVARVKWFNNNSGLGFVAIPGMEDAIIHHTEINQKGFKTLETNDLIEFDLIKTAKGLAAKNINLIINKDV